VKHLGYISFIGWTIHFFDLLLAVYMAFSYQKVFVGLLLALFGCFYFLLQLVLCCDRDFKRHINFIKSRILFFVGLSMTVLRRVCDLRKIDTNVGNGTISG
jgi:hypothetical protein